MRDRHDCGSHNEETRRVRRTVHKAQHNREIPSRAARRTARAIPSAPRRVRRPSTYVAANRTRSGSPASSCVELDLREGEKVTVPQIEATAPEWNRARHHKLGNRRLATQKSTKRALSRVIRSPKPWLRFLGWLDEPNEPCKFGGAEIVAYERWIRAERGYAEGTIGKQIRCVEEFFDCLAASGKQLASVQVSDIDDAIEAKKARRHYSRVTIRGHAERLRAFVRFAEHRGWCTPGMAEGVLPGRFHPGEQVRSTLSRVDIRRLLATTDGDRPADKRDRAILMLLIVYGLRAGEVRGLQLDDLDWPAAKSAARTSSRSATVGPARPTRNVARAPPQDRADRSLRRRSPKPLDKPSFGTFSKSARRVLNGLYSSPSRHRSDR